MLEYSIDQPPSLHDVQHTGRHLQQTTPGVFNAAESLALNEFVPSGIKRVQAVYNGRVPDLDNAPVEGIVVAVVDTGRMC